MPKNLPRLRKCSTNLPEQRAFGLGVVWVEFVDLGVEQVGEEEGVVFGAGGGWDFGVKAAPLLGCIAGHKRLADGFGVCEDSGLDGFLFCGGVAWHLKLHEGVAILTGSECLLATFE